MRWYRIDFPFGVRERQIEKVLKYVQTEIYPAGKVRIIRHGWYFMNRSIEFLANKNHIEAFKQSFSTKIIGKIKKIRPRMPLNKGVRHKQKV